jgi:hypothetical protein
MKTSTLAATLILSATCSFAMAEKAPRAQTSSGPGIIVASDASGGFFASGDVATYRVLNASPSVGLGPLSATVGRSQGFKILSNGCSTGLGPRQSCLVRVSWTSSSMNVVSHAELVLASSKPDIESRSSLTGDASLSRR